MKKLFLLTLILFLSGSSVSASDELIKILKDSEKNARETAKTAEAEAEYFSGLISLLNKAVKNRTKYGKESRIEILKAFKSHKITKSSGEAAIAFFMENDPSYTDFMKSHKLTLKINTGRNKVDETLTQQLSDSIHLNLKKHGIIFNNSDPDLSINIDFDIVSQKISMPEFKMKSQRASALVRILSKDGIIKGSSSISEPSVHIDEKTASINAVKKLSDSAAAFIINFMLEESLK